MSSSRNYYEILGLDPAQKSQYSQTDIVKAYRKKALVVHPDKHPAAERDQWTAEFKILGEAFATLKDPLKRTDYDHGAGNTGGFFNAPNFGGNRTARPGHRPSPAEEARKAQSAARKAAEAARDAALNQRFKELKGFRGFLSKFIAVFMTPVYLLFAAVFSLAVCTAFFINSLVGIISPRAAQWLNVHMLRMKSQEKQGRAANFFFALIIPFIAVAMVPYSFFKNMPTQFKTLSLMLSTKLQSRKFLLTTGGVILGSILLGVAAGLLVAFPPAGLAAILGAGGVVASALGMGSLSAIFLAPALAGLVTGIALGFSTLVSIASVGIQRIAAMFKSPKTAPEAAKPEPKNSTADMNAKMGRNGANANAPAENANANMNSTEPTNSQRGTNAPEGGIRLFEPRNAAPANDADQAAAAPRPALAGA